MEAIALIQNNKLEELRKCLEDYDESSSSLFVDGVSLAHWASSSKDLEILKAVINKFPSLINAKASSDGGTPLHWAALDSLSQNTTILIEYGAIIEPDSLGETPLHLAAMNGDVETTSILLNSIKTQELINHKSLDGDTALHFAVKNSHNRIISLLLSYGANPNVENSSNLTPKAIAVERNLDGLFDPNRALLHNEIEILKDNLAEAEEMKKALESNSNKQSRLLRETYDIVASLESKNTHLNTEIERLQNIVKEKDLIIKKLSDQCNILTEDKENLLKEYKELQTQLSMDTNPIQVEYPTDAIKFQTEEALKSISSLQRLLDQSSLSIISAKVSLDRLKDSLPYSRTEM